VVEENPLSFATSRMVTITALARKPGEIAVPEKILARFQRSSYGLY
jgi:hypothetical protein